jgi:hypothetical protein
MRLLLAGMLLLACFAPVQVTQAKEIDDTGNYLLQ